MREVVVSVGPPLLVVMDLCPVGVCVGGSPVLLLPLARGSGGVEV